MNKVLPTPEGSEGHVDFRNGMQGIPSEKFAVTPSVEAPVPPSSDDTDAAKEPAIPIVENVPLVPVNKETVPQPDLSPPFPDNTVATGAAAVSIEKNTPSEVINSASRETAPPADLHGREKWYIERWKINAEGITLESKHELGSPEVSPSSSETK